MNIEFTYRVKGLTVQFDNISDRIKGANLLWKFGDHLESVSESPEHVYTDPGRYTVTLAYYMKGSEVGSYSQTIVVSDKVKTTLSDTIYTLINKLLPSEVFGEIDKNLKSDLIRKWQLYIAPLVNHRIPLEDIYNEFFYEALENQLIMELAAYDYMVLKVNHMIQGLSTEISSKPVDSEGDGEGNVKHITTGPTEVEYFNPDDFASDVLSNIIKAMNPDGIIDLMKQQICMLAERLDIYLPICQRLPAKRVVPRVVNRRRETFLGGPDPMEVVNK